MRIEYDRDTYIGMFRYVDEWGGSGENVDDSKADLVNSRETDDGVFVHEIPGNVEFDAKFTARVCSVEAIRIFDDDGEQFVP